MIDDMVYDMILYYGNPKGAESYLSLVKHLVNKGWTKLPFEPAKGPKIPPMKKCCGCSK